jgi:hypothetical protein
MFSGPQHYTNWGGDLVVALKDIFIGQVTTGGQLPHYSGLSWELAGY